MADNLTVVAKIGETGKVITVVLKDTQAGVLSPVDLTGYTNIKMQVETSGGEVIMNEVACVADADQSTNPGLITCTTDITVAVHAGLRAGTFPTPFTRDDHVQEQFRLEFSALNAGGKKCFWPIDTDTRRTYGIFIVQEALN